MANLERGLASKILLASGEEDAGRGLQQSYLNKVAANAASAVVWTEHRCLAWVLIFF